MAVNPFRFVLTGSLEGQTINLGGHQFVDGFYEFVGPEPQISPSLEEAGLKAIYLAKSYQAYPEGSQALAEAQERLRNNQAPAGEVNVGEREQAHQNEAGDKLVSGRVAEGLIRTAITQLDPNNDEHWTGQGLPSVEAVRTLSANKDISRQDIQNLAPNLTREEATRIAALDPLNQ
jgi:hypothetical protein